MKNFKLSPIHLPPIKKVKVKKTHYRVILATASVCILMVHYYSPDFEPHVALAVNLLFIIDPTA